MILVTGAGGFVGGHVVRALARAGERVRALVRDARGAASLDDVDCELARGDVTDAASLRAAVEGCTAVVHLVAILDGKPADFERVMTQGTASLLDAARDAGVRRFVQMSALGTSEQTKDTVPYYRAKWAIEEAVRASGLEPRDPAAELRLRARRRRAAAVRPDRQAGTGDAGDRQRHPAAAADLGRRPGACRDAGAWLTDGDRHGSGTDGARPRHGACVPLDLPSQLRRSARPCRTGRASARALQSGEPARRACGSARRRRARARPQARVAERGDELACRRERPRSGSHATARLESRAGISATLARESPLRRIAHARCRERRSRLASCRSLGTARAEPCPDATTRPRAALKRRGEAACKKRRGPPCGGPRSR